MSLSPKRKASTSEHDLSIPSFTSSSRKKARVTESGNPMSQSQERTSTTAAMPIPSSPVHSKSNSTAPDSQIDHTAAINYWSSTAPTVSGVLGGFPEVSKVDLRGSRNFLSKLLRLSKPSHTSKLTTENIENGTTKKESKPLSRAVDCGAGIGRITRGLLIDFAEKVDVVEPVKNFTDQLVSDIATEKGAEGCIGRIWNVGLEEWNPASHANEAETYDLIWNQWCLSQLSDQELTSYLRRLHPPTLTPSGWIVVKENLSTSPEDIFDDVDSSVTRTDEKWRSIFTAAGLKVMRWEDQKGLPVEGLFPVRAYGLQPA